MRMLRASSSIWSRILLSSVFPVFVCAALPAQEEAERETRPIRELLPDLETQRRLARFELVPALAKAVPHVPVTMREHFGDDVVSRRAAELLCGGAPGRVHQPRRGKLLDGREVYTALGPRDEETPMRDRVLLIHDPAAGTVAGQVLPVVTMYFAWEDCPLLQQVDLDRDGRFELVFSVHHHNGTVEDWDARHYVQAVGQELVPLLVLQDNVKDVWPPYPESLRRQELMLDREGGLRVVTWYEDVGACDTLAPLGWCRLRREVRGGAFAEQERKAWVPGAEWVLGIGVSDLAIRR